MNSYVMSNALGVYNDPLMTMLSSMDSTSTFFDPFGPTPFPWALGPKLQPTCDETIPAELQTFTQAQLDALKCDLASPIPSPCPSFFEIKDDTTKYEPCYDEFMDTKLAVIKELSEKANTKHIEPVIDDLEPIIDELSMTSSSASAYPFTTLDSIFDDAYVSPDTFIDDLWEQMNGGSDHFLASPCPSISTTYSASTASSGPLSTPTPPTSTFTLSCLTSEPDVSTSCFDLWANETDFSSVDDNHKDGDYQPYMAHNEFREAPRKRHVKKQTVQRPQVPTQIDLFSVSLPDSTKNKRKAPTMTHDTKRQKVDPEVVCRIKGCRHISKTRFECFKHRETHFPGRFRCPHPDCLKVFVRSSSLARHLKRPRNVTCSSYAGSQSEWGVGLINFVLRPPAWLEPGFLDDITEL